MTDESTLTSCQYSPRARSSRIKYPRDVLLKAKDSCYGGTRSRRKNAGLLVSSPRKSVETQAHLSASNIDRERLLRVPLFPPVAFLPLLLSARLVPPYVPSSSRFLRANKKRHRAIFFHLSRFNELLSPESQSKVPFPGLGNITNVIETLRRNVRPGNRYHSCAGGEKNAF